MGQEVDVADAIRCCENYRKDKLYILIVPDKCEVFISSAKQDLDPLTGAALDAFSRLTSLAWQNSTTDRVIDQLSKASRSKKDLPGIIAKLIKEHDFDNVCCNETD